MEALLFVSYFLYILLYLHRIRRYKGYERVRLQSPDDHDGATADGLDNPMSKIPSSKELSKKHFNVWTAHY